MPSIRSSKRLAGIQYAGLASMTASCCEAVMRIFQSGDRVDLARLLSCAGRHCFLLDVNTHDRVAVRSGFGSGYHGEGARGLSFVPRLLTAHGAEIEEYEVDHGLIARVDEGSLTASDLEVLDAALPVRPMRWYDYLLDDRLDDDLGELWSRFPPVVPFGIIDSRIADLALVLLANPDESLLKGYRRLEGIVRKRTGLDEKGAKLFSQAFLGDKPKLAWEGIADSETRGRASLSGTQERTVSPKTIRRVAWRNSYFSITSTS
jgi:hypothetical protein